MPDYPIKYDPVLQESNRDWARDHTLRSAFKASALWYYQALARRAGLDAETRVLHQFQYGNEDTSGGLDRVGEPFWIDGTLRISADEQVTFLKRFHDGHLALSDRTTRLTKAIIVAERTPKWTLSAKTGACQPVGEATANWYVGFVEKGSETYYFALEMGDKDFSQVFKLRISKVREILTDLGILN